MLSLTKSRLSGKKLFFIFIFILLSSFLFSTIINVPVDQPTIQEGINVAVDGDTVLVQPYPIQPNTYVENINFNGKLITVASLFLTTQDTSYISSTIIDGSSSGSVVTFNNGENSSAILCGFTITNGLASGTFPANSGGGIYCNSSSPSLENLKILENSAYNGAGIGCINNSNPNISNALIVQNTAMNNGGAIYCGSSNPDIINITSSNNVVFGMGGAIFAANSNPSLKNSILWNDTAPEISVQSGQIDVSYTDVQGSWPGTGNLNVDPNFLNFIIGIYGDF